MTPKAVVLTLVAVVSLIVVGLATLFLTSRRPAPSGPKAPPRYQVVVTAEFADQLKSWSGCAASTTHGAMLAWCGHRGADGSTSGLVFLSPSDTTLKMVDCAGGGPDGVEYASAAFDRGSDTFFVFGGWADTKPTNEFFRLNLARTPLAWERIVTNGPKPSARNGAPMVLDAPRDRLIICGGDAGSGNFQPLADCWQFDLASSTWRPLNPKGQPSARWHAAMVADPTHQKAYLFGGAGTGRFDATLYELDLPTDTWRPLATTGSPPPSLQGATFTLDQATGTLLLAGGLRHERPGPATISQAWVYDPATAQWDVTDCGEPLRRRDHLAIYSAATGEHLLVGGRISNTVGNFFDRGAPVTQDVRLKVQPIAPPRPSSGP